MNIAAVDLNLLHVLHAVLAEKSATRAARRLHVTQSAVSNALSRLRHVFGDPLLVRNARGLSPTPRARQLQPQLESVMRSLGALMQVGSGFDPTSTTREFSLACADYCTTILGPALVALLQARAPRATLRFVPLEQLGNEGLATDIDVHVGMPSKVPSGCRSSALFDDSFVCMLPRGAKRSPAKLNLKAYLAAPHVRVSVLSSRQDPVDLALAKRGLARQVVLTVPHFSVVPLMVAQGGYIATLSRRLAQSQASIHPVALGEPPIALGRRATRMIWHERTHTDAGARFFRELVHESCRVE